MKASTEQDYRERIVRTLVYIQQRLDDELELEQVAGVAAFSSFHFHRIFRGLVGETLKRTTLGKTNSGSTAAGFHGADIICAMSRPSSSTSIHRGTPSRKIC
jgi:AraC-like DNA-binding protein